MSTLSFKHVGVFGKIPAQGDFLRAGGTSPVVLAFDHWLEESLDGLRRAGASLPSEPVYFVYRATGVPEVLVGALVASVDAVGRVFPLAVFGVIDGATLAPSFPLVPTACARFFAAAGELLSQSKELDPGELVRRVGALGVPTAEETLAAEGTQRAVLSHARTGELVARLFPGPAGQHLYAFRTFLLACEPLRRHEAQRSGVTLDCPVRSPIDRFAWLELARRVLAWTDSPPSLLWADAPTPRLLVSLGPASPSLLLYLARPDNDSARLWPLRTERAAAIEEAGRALAAVHRSALEQPELSLEALITSLSRP